MSKYAPLALRATAAAMSVTSAIAAFPAAENLFGQMPGGVMVASTSAVIYAGWHIVATSENTDHKIVSGVIASVSSVFEIVTPALLLLAGMFTRRQQPVNTASTPVNSVLTQENHEVTESLLTPSVDVLTDPLTALTERVVMTTADGNITAAAVTASTGCTDRQARVAISTAAEQGILTKSGSGNATRYTYSRKLRAIK